MAEPNTRVKYDAVLVPADYPPGVSGPAKALAYKREFASVLGAKLVHAQHTVGDMNLLAARPTHRYNDQDHFAAGEDRFDWVDRGDGVLYGLLTDAAKADPAGPAAARFAAAARTPPTAYQEDGRKRYEELKAVPDADLTDDERAERDKLGRFVAVWFPGSGVPAPAHGPKSGAVPTPPAPAVPRGPGTVAPISDARAAAVAETGKPL